MKSPNRRIYAAVLAIALLGGTLIFQVRQPIMVAAAQTVSTATATPTSLNQVITATTADITATATTSVITATATPIGATATPIITPTATSPILTPTATVPVIPPTGENITSRTVSVNGSGFAEIQPDIAIVDLGVTTDAASAREALSENNQQMEALINALLAAGIANADIRTQTIQIYPRYDSTPPQPVDQTGQPANRLTGYTATNIVQVTIRDLNNLGQVLDQAVSAGSNQIQGIRFDISDRRAAMDQAREAAMQDARHKASQLASLAGAQLGVVVSIQEVSYAPLPFMDMAAAEQRASAAAVPVSPGTQQVTVDVQVTWELR